MKKNYFIFVFGLFMILGNVTLIASLFKGNKPFRLSDDYKMRTMFFANGNGSPKYSSSTVNDKITNGAARPKSQDPIPAPYDVVSDQSDDNGLPKNPKWGWQITHPGSLPSPDACSGNVWESPCTTQFTWIDNNKGLCPTGLGGHANWGPVTYEGIVFWEGHTCSVQDDDYNIDIWRSDGAALTAANDNVHNNNVTLHTEFNSDETVDNFHTKWWNSFHSAVDNGTCGLNGIPGNWPEVPPLIDGDSAIIIGLLGLDCAHSCHAELHPVYAMAIHTKSDPKDDVWTLFVRNWGDEGYCASNGSQPLALNKISFRLYRPAAADVTITSQDVEFGFTNTQTNNAQSQFSATISPIDNEGALLTFTLPPSEAHGFIDGEIHLNWTIKMLHRLQKSEPLKMKIHNVDNGAKRESDEAETNAINEFGAMASSQRAVFKRLLNESKPKITYSRLNIEYAPTQPSIKRNNVGPFYIPDPNLVIRDQPDPISERRREQRIKAYQTAIGSN